MTRALKKKKIRKRKKNRNNRYIAKEPYSVNNDSNNTNDMDTNHINEKFENVINLNANNNNIKKKYSFGDFHLHSKHSDGKLSPSDVIRKAYNNGVKYVSLTDHDTMAGIPEAMKEAKKLNMIFIPGVEISTEMILTDNNNNNNNNKSESIHILGYFDPDRLINDKSNKLLTLEEKLKEIREGRYHRGKMILSKLNTLGIKLEWERVLEVAGEAAPGRPHIAQVLVENKHVKTFKDAFIQYLSNDGPAYYPGIAFSPEEAISLIKESGGISILAHPWCIKRPKDVILQLANSGLDGIEVYRDEDKISIYRQLAKDLSLIMSGGSDFHGIDPFKERDPGEISFHQKAFKTFINQSTLIWKRNQNDM